MCSTRVSDRIDSLQSLVLSEQTRMSLTQVSVAPEQFHDLHSHLMTHRGGRNANMHLRETRQEKGVDQLRYLHAMKADGPNRILGSISGPNLLCEYELTWNGRRTQLAVRPLRVAAKEDARLGRQFLKEIFRRVKAERERDDDDPIKVVRLKGEYYLVRRSGGMPVTHPICIAAVTAGVIDQRFAAILEKWNLALLVGKADRRPKGRAPRKKA
ncbi:MAG: hypothetical protein JWN04_6513 [Myxococcaceae bacterium]|nr:hypothetical protein [Myxococcaceae bacterium]